MPFRLTRQLAGTLAPHDAGAVLRQPMGAAMGALREGAAILQVPPCMHQQGCKIHTGSRRHIRLCWSTQWGA
jgi:hypothetical protein